MLKMTNRARAYIFQNVKTNSEEKISSRWYSWNLKHISYGKLQLMIE